MSDPASHGVPGDPTYEVVEAAPAKINLYLHLIGRRDDGYHLLESLIVFTEYGDRVSVRPASELSLSVSGPFAGQIGDLGERNLVMRAATALAAACGTEPRAAIRLEKNLPVAAGIGGGSADAAAALRALRRLWDLRIDDAQYRQLAMGLGADVPACLVSRPVVATGIGEALRALDGARPKLTLVLVNPLKSLATAAVFAARAGAFEAAGPRFDMPNSAEALIAALGARRNDLQPAACSLEPSVADALALLGAQAGCGLARMSGSGATCFGVFVDPSEAREAARGVIAARPDWWVVETALR